MITIPAFVALLRRRWSFLSLSSRVHYCVPFERGWIWIFSGASSWRRDRPSRCSGSSMSSTGRILSEQGFRNGGRRRKAAEMYFDEDVSHIAAKSQQNQQSPVTLATTDRPCLRWAIFPSFSRRGKRSMQPAVIGPEVYWPAPL